MITNVIYRGVTWRLLCWKTRHCRIVCDKCKEIRIVKRRRWEKYEETKRSSWDGTVSEIFRKYAIARGGNS
jgi:hypothetical protein